MDNMLQKNLQVGWYPFGDYREPSENSFVLLDKFEEKQRTLQNKKLYSLSKSNSPKISITCIAGKNGSGKSTLLDIMFRIINNVAERFLLNDKYVSLERSFGVDADLHFEINKKPGFIRCSNTDIEYFWGYNKKGEPKKIKDDCNDSYKQLSNFFYTISINYSLYAYNCSDYYPKDSNISKFSKGIDGGWIKHLFHKNDGYLTPLVLAPFRDDKGNINIVTEKKLANQRLTTLILLFYFQGKQFIPGYEPTNLYYRYDQNYLEPAIKNLYDESAYSRKKFEHIISNFYQVWSRHFETKEIDFKSVIIPGQNNPKRMCLRYLAYKTYKICLTYAEYKQMYDEYKSVKRGLEKIISKLLDSVDHITVKIHQCINFINTNLYQGTNHTIGTNILMSSLGIKNSYDNMMIALPPSFFYISVEMRKCKSKVKNNSGFPYLLPFNFSSTETFYLEDMSSGERQFLYSISYALYHIKNLENIENGFHRVHYKHINLVLDEVELYYHPEYQRKYIQMLLESLKWCGFSSSKINSINIILVTHSPFILSDMVHNNVLYLDEGKPKIVRGKTFGANYYDLLYNSFFFDKNAIGEVATRVISDMIKNPYLYRDSKFLYDIIGDPLIKGYLLNRIGKNVQN